MIASRSEFEDSTAFELWALEGLAPLASDRPHPSVRDIESNSVAIMLGGAVEVNVVPSRRQITVDLRPLAFGAAWKVLDLLIELAVSVSTVNASSTRLSIKKKVDRARVRAGTCPPISQDASIWDRLTSLYVATEDVRHSLVHRRADVDRANGDLTGTDDLGSPINPISAAEQIAFCRAVQRAALAVIHQSLSPRERRDLYWNLDQLARLHQLPLLGGRAMEPAPLGVWTVSSEGDPFEVDFVEIDRQLRSNFPDAYAIDLSIELRDGRRLLAQLETAIQHGKVIVDPSNLPDWICHWDGSEA